MEKLKLDLQQLNAEVLTRSQMKTILGGLLSGDSCWCAHYTSGGFDRYSCGMTQSQAMAQATSDAEKYGNGHYCHDNCGISDPCTP